MGRDHGGKDLTTRLPTRSGENGKRMGNVNESEDSVAEMAD